MVSAKVLAKLCHYSNGCKQRKIRRADVVKSFAVARFPEKILFNMPTIMRAKVAIVGDTKSGKTALTQMFLTGNYPKVYNMTLGVDLSVKTVKIPDREDSVELYLYDSSGRDIYRAFLPRYWRKPDLVLAVFDVTNQESFDAIPTWISMARGEDHAPCVLYGTHVDLTNRRVVSPKAASSLASELGCRYLEGSSKESVGTEEPFYLLAHEWHQLCAKGQGDSQDSTPKD